MEKCNNPNLYNMRGMSMLPTLRPGEGLLIDSRIDKKIFQIGDIIVYSAPKGHDKYIVHRIIKICKDGYITRGDNNKGPDDYIVKYSDILGKASSVRRSSETIPLSNGFKGYLLHQILKTRKHFSTYLLKIPSLISKCIDKSRIFNVFHKLIKFDIVVIKKNDHIEEVLIHRNKLIGRKSPKNGRWTVRFPYKYFIDRKKLSGDK